MNIAILSWLVIFAILGGCYFVIAAFVAITGVSDIKALLTQSNKTKEYADNERPFV